MFITVEGVEGSGKSTLLAGLAERFRVQGKDVLLTREPGGSVLGRGLRSLLLNTATCVTEQAELFLFLADRAQHVDEIIRPALQAGRVVLCDRYTDSTVVYQGYGRGLDTSTLSQFNDFATAGLVPDRTLVLDIDSAVGLSRARNRNEGKGASQSEGRFEAEALAFHQRIRQGFLEWSARHPQRCVVLDASCCAQDLLAAAWSALKGDPPCPDSI